MRRATIADVLHAVAAEFNVGRMTLFSHDRRRQIVRPRHVAMALAAEFTASSLTDISRRFERKDHSVVINAKLKTRQRCADDPVFGERVERVREHIRRRMAA